MGRIAVADASVFGHALATLHLTLHLMKVKTTMMMMMLLLATVAFPRVEAHGFLVGPGRMAAAAAAHAVRNYAAISSNIDALRNPMSSASFCRGAASGPPAATIALANGLPLTLTLAFSIGAQHVGPCWVEVVDPLLPNEPVVIAATGSDHGCAVAPIADIVTNKASPASSQCPGRLPLGLVTNDMCLVEWTFAVSNAQKITCSTCILRWIWHAEHISKTNPEVYENCIDVLVHVGQDAGSSREVVTELGPQPRSSTTHSPPLFLGASPGPSSTPSAQPHATHTQSSLETSTAIPRKSSDRHSNGHHECKKSHSNGPFMACSKDRSGFFACFREKPHRDPKFRSCPTGTRCRQAGKYASCH